MGTDGQWEAKLKPSNVFLLVLRHVQELLVFSVLLEAH